MRNTLPDVDGFEKNEKLDIAMRPEQVSCERFGAVTIFDGGGLHRVVMGV